MLGYVALHEHRGHIRVEPDREQHGRQFEGLGAHDSRGVDDRQCVQVHDSMEDVSRMLSIHPVGEGTEVISEVYGAGGLDARQDAGHL